MDVRITSFEKINSRQPVAAGGARVEKTIKEDGRIDEYKITARSKDGDRLEVSKAAVERLDEEKKKVE